MRLIVHYNVLKLVLLYIIRISKAVTKWEEILTMEASSTLKETGRLVQLARKRRRMSSVELGRRVGIDRRTVANLEHGNPGVSLGVFMQVLSVLNLTAGFVEALRPENDLDAITGELRRARRKGRKIKEILPEEVDF